VQIPYSDRTQAGRTLGEHLRQYADRDDVLVLALPRGGLPVAAEVAPMLYAPLDLLLVRKLGMPGQEELAMGAIATGDALVLNRAVIRGLGVTDETIHQAVHKEKQELHRRLHMYRGDRPEPALKDKIIILIDDGLATGATMRSAVQAVRQRAAKRVVVAVPVASPDTADSMRSEVDELVCPATPDRFFSVGQWYDSFPQITDDEVRNTLQRAWAKEEKQT